MFPSKMFLFPAAYYCFFFWMFAAEAIQAYHADEVIESPNLRRRLVGKNRTLQEWQTSLAIVADHGLPVEAFPLGLCQGNCNVDDVSNAISFTY